MSNNLTSDQFHLFYEATFKRQLSAERLELECPILRDTTGTDFINIGSFDSVSFRMRREEEVELDINLINQDQYQDNVIILIL